jgi:hypothetical protein
MFCGFTSRIADQANSGKFCEFGGIEKAVYDLLHHFCAFL